MSPRNKFGFDALTPGAADVPTRRARDPGPMSAAVRDAAGSMAEETEAKLEQRRRNASDAKAYRAAEAEGLVLQRFALSEIGTDDLPRDRMALSAVAVSDEMEELKASIKARGQKEPVEVYVDADGRLQLKKGWRRLTALRQLSEETGDPAYATIVARVDRSSESRISRYVDMVEENVIREDLSFAEMAQVAIAAAQDPAVPETDADAIVNRLYASLHKMKRSYIRSFVYLLSELGDALLWPKVVARNVGVELARGIKTGSLDVDELRSALRSVKSVSEQARVIAEFLDGKASGVPAESQIRQGSREKYEFRVGAMKVTARKGEFRITSGLDYSSVDRDALERAVRAFELALSNET
ncbi:MAG: ParB N-terminal domain-containing protein [Pseudomonadota bacterium]